MIPRRIPLNNRGFTLIEVMVALVAFVALTLIFAACVPVARKTAKSNGQYSQAISLCQHKIDQLRAVGYGRVNYDELSDAGIIDDSPSSPPYSFTGVDDVATYLPQPTARLTVATMGEAQILVTATITWKTTTYQSKSSSASLSAIITNVE